MRVYDGKYLSVTSIVGLRHPFDKESFKKWCERTGNNASLIASTSRILGEKVSDYIEDHFRGLTALSAPAIDKLEQDMRWGVIEFLREWEILDCEKVVTCEQFNYAGRYDGKIRNKKTGERLLADWKTFGAWKDSGYKRDSAKIKHTRWQTTMYKYADGWKDDTAVVIFKNDGTYEIEKLDYDQEMMDWIKDNQKLILNTIKENL